MCVSEDVSTDTNYSAAYGSIETHTHAKLSDALTDRQTEKVCREYYRVTTCMLLSGVYKFIHNVYILHDHGLFIV